MHAGVFFAAWLRTETVPNVQEEVPETARDCYINVFRAKVVPERIRSFSMPADGIVSN